ncbi:MAG: DUF3750 domain-containing protein [Myxococcales bacterium]|nr:DUF3750 domain-containing protein [Myxococcales bacterium]
MGGPKRVAHRRAVLRAALGWFVLCLVGHLASPPPTTNNGPGPIVRLMRAPLPSPLGWAAQHYWLATRNRRELVRWEVWQDADQGGKSWGHVHRNFMPWNSGVGGGPAELVKEWRGSGAQRFSTCIEERGPVYRDRELYRAWPGPNSNTFVDAMLRECGLTWTLDGSGVGKDYRGLLGVSLTSGGTGVQVETPVLGLLLGLLLGIDEGVQVHVLALTLGIDVWPPAIVHPVGDGRFGFADADLSTDLLGVAALIDRDRAYLCEREIGQEKVRADF